MFTSPETPYGTLLLFFSYSIILKPIEKRVHLYTSEKMSILFVN